MTNAEREKIANDMLDRANVLRQSKGMIYSGVEDVLGNFKRVSRIGVSPLQVAAVYLLKHIDSIVTAVNKNPETGATEDSESFESRLLDAINYLILMGALSVEGGRTGRTDRDKRVDTILEAINKQVLGETVTPLPHREDRIITPNPIDWKKVEEEAREIAEKLKQTPGNPYSPQKPLYVVGCDNGKDYTATVIGTVAPDGKINISDVSMDPRVKAMAQGKEMADRAIATRERSVSGINMADPEDSRLPDYD